MWTLKYFDPHSLWLILDLPIANLPCLYPYGAPLHVRHHLFPYLYPFGAPLPYIYPYGAPLNEYDVWFHFCYHNNADLFVFALDSTSMNRLFCCLACRLLWGRKYLGTKIGSMKNPRWPPEAILKKKTFFLFKNSIIWTFFCTRI